MGTFLGGPGQNSSMVRPIPQGLFFQLGYFINYRLGHFVLIFGVSVIIQINRKINQ